MSTAPTATSTSAPSEAIGGAPDHEAWPLLPVETEIYILPDGRVVVADLPAELAPLLAALGIADASMACATPTPPVPAPALLEATAADE